MISSHLDPETFLQMGGSDAKKTNRIQMPIRRTGGMPRSEKCSFAFHGDLAGKEQCNRLRMSEDLILLAKKDHIENERRYGRVHGK